MTVRVGLMYSNKSESLQRDFCINVSYIEQMIGFPQKDMLHYEQPDVCPLDLHCQP